MQMPLFVALIGNQIFQKLQDPSLIVHDLLIFVHTEVGYTECFYLFFLHINQFFPFCSDILIKYNQLFFFLFQESLRQQRFRFKGSCEPFR